MHVENYDSLEEMQAAMQKAETAANARVTDAQHRISFGDHWMQPMGPEYNYLVIFGRVQPVDELMASDLLGVTSYQGEEAYGAAIATARLLLASANIQHDSVRPLVSALRGVGELEGPMAALQSACDTLGVTTGDDWDDWVDTAVRTLDSYRRGYRFGTAWSLWEPRGEYGSTHISQMIPLSGTEFADVKTAEWDFKALSAHSSGSQKRWAMNIVLTGAPACFKREVTS